MKTLIKTVLLTFGILILLVGSLGAITYGTESFSEPSYCKSADAHYEKAEKFRQENKLKQAEGQVFAMESSQKYCNEYRAATKSKLRWWSAATILGLLMAIGGFFIREKKL